MDVVFFPPWPEGAHMVRNDTDSTARVLMFSNVSKVAATVYPDSDKISSSDGAVRLTEGPARRGGRRRAGPPAYCSASGKTTAACTGTVA